MKSTHPIIAALNAYISANLTAADVEAAYDAFLDGAYSFSSVGGPFEYMQPSEVLKECAPTDYRCGCADWSDGEDFTEVEGETYRDDELDASKAEFVAEREKEITDIENDISMLEEDPEDDENETVNGSDLKLLRASLAAVQAELAALEDHSF